MIKIHLDAGSFSVKYDISIGEGIVSLTGEFLENLDFSGVVVISNSTVMKLHGEKLLKSLKQKKFPVRVIEVPDGEQYKNLDQLAVIYQEMVESGVDRKSLIIPFGGGVIGDIGGFAAATFMRGLSYIHAPTTLVAQVDSSIGGKVGVDLPTGKNLVGSFYHPLAVITDPTVLSTLEEGEFSNGIAEVIKSAVIGSPQLMEKLEQIPARLQQISYRDLEDIVFRTAKIKVNVVKKDVLESGERMKLNLGHTIGHALEASLDYTKIKHGEAVAVGMVGACEIARRCGVLKDSSLPRQVEKLLLKFNLPTRCPGVSPDDVYGFLSTDKKRTGKTKRFILPEENGKVIIYPDPDEKIIRSTIDYLCQK